MSKKCRVCGNDFYQRPLFKLENMPAAAQNLPDQRTVKRDKGNNIEVCQCSGCGLIQLTAKPVSYFRDVIRAAAYSPEMKSFRLKQFAAFLKKHSLKGKKVLEVGCGKGEYLTLMKQAGADVYGLEHAAESIHICRKQGLAVEQGYFEQKTQELKNSPFDAFFILNYLEHLPNINTVLAAIGRNLAPDAIGLVEVPNFDLMIKTSMFAEFISDHLFYFTQETLTNTLRLNGFDVLACEPIWHDYIISAQVKKREPLDLSGLEKAKKKLTNEIMAFLKPFSAGSVAVWGAGHQALAVLAVAVPSKKIKYVIDSAPFKQNKFTPATHLTIVGPECLKSDPVSAVMVMAGSYSNEVVRILRADYPLVKIKIAVLDGPSLKVI